MPTPLSDQIQSFYDASSGRVLLDGQDISHMKSRQLQPLRRKMQMIFQDPYASLNARMTVRDIIAEPLLAHHVAKSRQEIDEYVYPMLERVGLTREHAGRYAHEFSGGQRQRAWFAMALAQETPVLLLDEPTTYLDPAHAVEMLDLVRSVARAGRTVVMVLHDLMLAGMFSDRMVMMRSGEIVADGTPAEVLTADTLDEVYGLKADIVADPKSDVPIIVPRTTSGYSLSSRPSPASSTP